MPERNIHTISQIGREISEDTGIHDGENPETVELFKKKVEEYKKITERVIETFKHTAFARFTEGYPIKVVAGESYGVNTVSGTIRIDVTPFAEGDYNFDQIGWAVMMQLSQFRDFIVDKPGMQQRIAAERNSPYRRSLEVFRKSFDSLYHRHQVADKVPIFQSAFKGGKEVQKLYKEKLMPDIDLTNLPLHLQFIKACSQFDVLNQLAIVDPEVEELLGTPIVYNKKQTTVREVVKMLRPRVNKELLPSERYEILENTIQPLYEELLEEDLDEEARGNGLPEGLDSDLPPEDQDEYYPQDMESTEANGKSPYIFQIAPGLPGYYKGGVRTHFNKQTIRWTKQKQLENYDGSVEYPGYNYKGKVKGRVSLPLVYGNAISMDTLQSNGDLKIFRDEYGMFYAESPELQEFSFDFGQSTFEEMDSVDRFNEQLYSSQLSWITEGAIRDAKNLIDPEKGADSLIKYIRGKYTYNVKAQGLLYNSSTNSDEYFHSIDYAEELECYTSNTFFVGLCRKAGIPARLITGHHVGRNQDNTSDINRNNGHAWSEIYNGTEWVIKDATPPSSPEDFDDHYNDSEDGNPNQMNDGDMQDLESEQKNKKNESKESKKHTEEKEWCDERNIQYRTFQRYKQIEKNVDPYLQDLTAVWQKIVYGKSQGSNYGMTGHFKTGLELDVQKAIDDWADISSRDYENVRVMKRISESESEVKRPELIRVRLLLDVSASMNQADKVKALTETSVLALSSLNEFDRLLDLTRGVTKSNMRVDTEVIIFGSRSRTVKQFKDKINEKMEEEQIVKVFTYLESPGDGGTYDDEALNQVYDSLSAEEKRNIKDGKIMEVVIEITDGGSSNEEKSRKMVDKLLESNVIVRAMQIGSVDEYDRQSFDKVWNDGREKKLGFGIGSDVSKLAGAMTEALEEYLGNVQI